VITVNCHSPATVTSSTTFVVTLPSASSSSTADSAARKRKKRIRLKPVVTTVAPGQATAVKIKVPRKVARKYGGRKVRAKIKVTAVDAAGNSSTARTTKTIKLAKLKKKRS
jgi:hypothetical protein